MERNELKKALYKQNPMATFQNIKNGVAYYNTYVRIGEPILENYQIKFEIPVNDMGEANFEREMEAKYLIRWIV
jgi:hypothetical protein